MATRLALLLTALAAGALVALAPRLALSPGPMAAGHEPLAGDCLACHAVLRGVPEAKCAACHPLERLGERADGGASAWDGGTALGAFHLGLARRECRQCHAEHAGAAGAARFSHDALAPAARGRCASCHGARRPADELHAQAGDGCGSCHATDAWRPATFEHAKYFVLDRDHAVACRTCHEDPTSWRAYTCYGCHEHSRAKVAGEHLEEGIRDFEDCARCHKSADEHGVREGGEGEREREREGGRHEGREHDDD